MTEGWFVFWQGGAAVALRSDTNVKIPYRHLAQLSLWVECTLW